MSGAATLLSTSRKVKPVLPEAVTTPSVKPGTWIKKTNVLNPRPPTPPAAAGVITVQDESPSPPTAQEREEKHKDLMGDPEVEDDMPYTPRAKFSVKDLLVCGFCKGDGIHLTPECYQCKRSFCLKCQNEEPLHFIVDKVLDKDSNKEVFKCFGCLNESQEQKKPQSTEAHIPKKRRKGDEDSCEILMEETDEKSRQIDELLREYNSHTEDKKRTPPKTSVSLSKTASIIRILPDPPPGPDLVYTPVDRSFCELPICLGCVANGVSIRKIKTATGVSTMCGHAIYCVNCTVECLGHKGVICPYPDCDTVIDTIVLIQNSVQKQ